MFSGVLTAEEVDEVDGVGDRWSGGTTVVDVQTLLGAFLNMSLWFACLIDESFSGKNQNFPQLPDYRMHD